MVHGEDKRGNLSCNFFFVNFHIMTVAFFTWWCRYFMPFQRCIQEIMPFCLWMSIEVCLLASLREDDCLLSFSELPCKVLFFVAFAFSWTRVVWEECRVSKMEGLAWFFHVVFSLCRWHFFCLLFFLYLRMHALGKNKGFLSFFLRKQKSCVLVWAR